MSDHHAPATDPDAAHAGGHDEHHDTGSLGAIDWRMWGAGLLGVVAAAAVLVAWVISTQFTFLAVH